MSNHYSRKDAAALALVLTVASKACSKADNGEMHKDSSADYVRPVRWIPVEERLPKLFQPVIVCRNGKDGKPMVEAGSMDHNGWWKVYGTRTKTVTHWMPLPEPPKEGKE